MTQVRELTSAAVSSLRIARKVAVVALGFGVVGCGVALVVLPGPGLLVITLGVAILATKFLWARRLLRPVRWLLLRLKLYAHRMLRRSSSSRTVTAKHTIERSTRKGAKVEDAVRGAILDLLSDDEFSRASTGKGADSLLEGEEYVDLERLDRGVQRGARTTRAEDGVILRRAVDGERWGRILTLLAPSDPRRTAAHRSR